LSPLFAHFDKDNSGLLDRIEFKAALSALSIPSKDEEAFGRVFSKVSEGNAKITKTQFVNYLIEINEDKDSADQIKSSFSTLADHSNVITAQQLKVPPLSEAEIGYLKDRVPHAQGETFDYGVYTEHCFQ